MSTIIEICSGLGSLPPLGAAPDGSGGGRGSSKSAKQFNHNKRSCLSNDYASRELASIIHMGKQPIHRRLGTSVASLE